MRSILYVYSYTILFDFKAELAIDPAPASRYDFASRMAQKRKSAKPQTQEPLAKLREAALELGVSFPTIKQWIYHGKIKSVRTAGGHHRIPQSEIDRLLY